MPGSGLTLIPCDPSTLTLPAAGKKTIILDSTNSDLPATVDDAGNVDSLEGPAGATGATGAAGADGADGTIVTFGTTAPSGGADGDVYIKTDTEEFYKKESGVWNLKYSVAGSGGGSGGLKLLGIYTGTGAASITAFSRTAAGTSGDLFQSDYRNYFVTVEIVPQTSGQKIYYCVSDDASTLEAGATDYKYAGHRASAAGHIQAGSNGDSGIDLALGGGHQNSSTEPFFATIDIFSPATGTMKRKIRAHSSINDGTGNPEVSATLTGSYQLTTTLKGFGIIMASGNITGTVFVYAREGA